MKALIRNIGETITEDMGIAGINWNDGTPLTYSWWCGGAYRLVNDYNPEMEDIEIEISVMSEETETETTETTEADAEKQKQIEELKKMLAELEN